MSKRKIRAYAAVGLLLVILALFGYYIQGHPAVIHALRNINPWLLIALIACYGFMLVVWMGLYNATLRLCGEPLKKKENLLLTIYSTLANFFLPLQSGPGVRAAYLKKKYKVPISSYIFASLVYYGIYAVISAGLLFIGSSYWWLAVPATLMTAAVSLFVLTFAKKHFEKKNPNLKLDLSRANLTRLLLLTLAQVLTQALIYGIELHTLNMHGTIRRYLSYTGAANFALFVALTPGAIGFREAFLEFSRQLHGFSTASILAASLIDRSVFLLFLGILFIIMLSTHAHSKYKTILKSE